MNNFGEQHCKLCLGLIRDEYFEEVKDMNPSVVEDPDLCRQCTGSRGTHSSFIKNHLEVEQTVGSYKAVSEGQPQITPSIDLYIKTEEFEIKSERREQHCKLCLGLIRDEHFEEVTDMNPSVVEDPDLCRQCTGSHGTHSSFIKNHLEVEETVDSYKVVSEGQPQLSSLIDLYITTEENEIKSERREQHCKLCLGIIRDEHFEEVTDMNPGVVEDPDLCRQCTGSHGTRSSFIKNHLEVEEKVDSYKAISEGQPQITPSIYIKTEIEIKSERMEQEEELLEVYPTIPICEDVKLNKIELEEIKLEDERPSDISSQGLKPENISETEENKRAPERFFEKLEKDAIYKDTNSCVYICHLCDFRFKHKNNLKHHQEKHSNNSKVEMYKCNLCDETIKTKYKLQIHQLRHSKVCMYTCDLCDYKTKYKSNLKLHQLKHADISQVPMYQCDMCDFKSKYKDSLYRHQLRRHADPSKPLFYACHLCGFTSKCKENLEAHLLKHTTPSKTRIYTCDSCDYISKNRKAFYLHLFHHQSNVQLYRCDVCDFMTKTKIRLEPHKLRHENPSEVEWYVCDLCDYKSKYKGNLNTHRLRHTDSPEIYRCDSCDYKTKIKKDFVCHQVAHKDSSPIQIYKCDSCDYKTNKKNHFNVHQLKHSGVPMYKCDLCGFLSKYKASLARHRLQHAGPSEVSTYKCNCCKFKTKYKDSLKTHQLNHDLTKSKIASASICI